MVPRFNIPLTTMRLSGIERSVRPRAVYRNLRTTAQWLMLKPVRQAYSIIEDFEPDFVLGTGGYVCAPVMVAARFRGIRCWILEQNSAPGLTVRLLARWVDGVAIAYEISRERLPGRACVELIGNPVLRSILTAERSTGIREFGLDPSRKTLLVMGGSLGSEALNATIRDLLLLDKNNTILQNWQILHAAGPGKFPDFIKQVPSGNHFHPVPFIYNTPAALAAADLVMCRAGAMTLAEVTARGIPSIVVPWPGAVRDHQTTNARALDHAGAAILIPESELSGVRIGEIIRSLNAYPARLEIMAQKARELGRPDAAERMADFILAGDNH